MILPEERDPRLVTIRRGGTMWAASCAEHVVHQAAAVAHVAAHELGAAAYAIKAARAAAPKGDGENGRAT